MKRLLISAFCGLAIVAGLIGTFALIIPPTNRVANSLGSVVAELLYWPSSLLVVGGLDCPNADSIADKLKCAGMCLSIDALAYSALIYMLLWMVENWRQRLGRR